MHCSLAALPLCLVRTRLVRRCPTQATALSHSHKRPPRPGPSCREPADARPFSEVVAEAKASGFTEPDPRDDLAGMDVARKVTILARCAALGLGGRTPAQPLPQPLPQPRCNCLSFCRW